MSPKNSGYPARSINVTAFSPLPKGFAYFQGIDEECGLDEERLKEVIGIVAGINPKLFLLQEMTGDL